MMTDVEKGQVSVFVKDGEKLAKIQILANKLISKLSSGNFWSAEDFKKILEESLCEVNKITH